MTDDELRDEVRNWLSANWDPDIDRASWAHIVVDAGWAVPSWEPECYGRGVSDAQSRRIAAATTVGICSPARCTMWGPTSKSDGSFRRRSAARANGACSTANPERGRIWRACAHGLSATVTSG